MSVDALVAVALRWLQVVAVLAGPPLVAVLVVGVAVGVVQAVTQINDPGMALVPKLVVVAVIVVVGGPWAARVTVDATRELWGSIPQLIGAVP